MNGMKWNQVNEFNKSGEELLSAGDKHEEERSNTLLVLVLVSYHCTHTYHNHNYDYTF